MLITSDGGATVAFCPQKASFVLPAAGEFTITATAIRASEAALGPTTPLTSCDFPSIEREASANLQTYGSAITRGATTAATPAGIVASRIEALLPAQRTALQAGLEPVNQALRLVIRGRTLC